MARKAPDPPRLDAVVVGAGHNGLVAAAVLARSGMRVLVLEAAGTVGGACRTEAPFESTPGLRCSTGAYLLGPMPPEVLAATGLRERLKILPRCPHGFFVLDDGSPAAFGVAGGLRFVSKHDRAALDALDSAVGAIRGAIAPTWLRDAPTLQEAVPLVPAEHRDAFRALASGDGADPRGGSIRVFVERFDIRDESLRAVLATDGFVGSVGGYDSPGTGLNFLAHNMLRLPPGDSDGSGAPLGAWQLVEGGMGAVTRALASAVEERGGRIRLGVRVVGLRIENGRVVGVDLADGQTVASSIVIVATDPFRARVICDHPLASPAFTGLDGKRTPGTSLKVNLAINALPHVLGAERLDLPEHGPLSGTVHVLPRGGTLERLERGRVAAVERGVAPDVDDMMIDVYTHTAVDPSLRDDEGRHAMSLFVQWVPPDISIPDAEALAWGMIRGPIARLMPDLERHVREVMVIPPRAIEARFGITGGHIHHLDNGFAFQNRLSARTPVQGLFLAGAGCHPAGSVVGAAGYIAAHHALAQERSSEQ